MHRYLRAVGFSNIESKKQIRDLMNDVIINPNRKEFIETGRDSILVEYSKNYCPTCGITLRGEYDDSNDLTLDFYYPFVQGDEVSTTENVSIERHADKESFAGLVEDYRVGASLIYYVQNGMSVMKHMSSQENDIASASTYLSALSLGGTIMLPIQKDPKQKELLRKASADRSKRIIAAKSGDEEAIEQLTLEDIDTYSAVSKRLLKEDVFTLVDSYFMPNGVECDHYSILAEIVDFRLETNTLSSEKVYAFNLNCNSLPLTLCINEKDLLGEPRIGRRFRGNIWLQGEIRI
ncbi:MAG: DUF3881 family protein [Lachnospiraceae bacterium]|nr:DUF3881 family protein [Lachnospiraceae bacterium]